MHQSSAEGLVRHATAVAELQTLSGKHLLPGFGEDENEHEERIAEAVQEISTLFKECERRLKHITDAKNDGPDDEVRGGGVCGEGEGGKVRGWEEGDGVMQPPTCSVPLGRTRHPQPPKHAVTGGAHQHQETSWPTASGLIA